ncbi:MAG: S49 family peptidase [Chloroflexota bacterium]|nr:MAG: S49 family peptidase [Chloroflexota bacterium]
MPNWSDVLNEIQREIATNNAAARRAVDTVRRNYLRQLFEYTKRNVIAYYSGFLSKPDIEGIEITDEDKNGFMMGVHRLDRSRGLDLIVHTPGGSIAATESLVDYLHSMFDDDIRVIVPQIAMSGGTMIACSSREIIMGKHSNLGPIDPQVRGIPALGVIEEFLRARREIAKDSGRAQLWYPILSQYRPTFLSQCENAVAWSNDFVGQQLREVMFRGDPKADVTAKAIVRALSGYRRNRTHNRHLHIADCQKLGLRVSALESDPILQDLVLTVHHCFMHSLTNTPAFKMIENHLGVAFVKQQAAMMAQGAG